jgi:hypothetical protein
MFAFFGFAPQELVLLFAIAIVMIVVPTIVAVMAIVALGRQVDAADVARAPTIHPLHQPSR